MTSPHFGSFGKRFESDLRVSKTFLQKNQRPKVTIAIGLISKTGRFQPGQVGQIVMASDSQTTYPGNQKRTDAKKINVVEFSNGKILVAQAGSAELADKAIEIMQAKAQGVELQDAETAPKLAQESIREI